MMKKLALAFGLLLGLYLIVRAIIEPFVIDLRDPSTYHLDWGGPHLAGVLAVHCLPGVIAAVLIARRIRARQRAQGQPSAGRHPRPSMRGRRPD
jgi:hypothetical protein